METIHSSNLIPGQIYLPNLNSTARLEFVKFDETTLYFKNGGSSGIYQCTNEGIFEFSNDDMPWYKAEN